MGDVADMVRRIALEAAREVLAAPDPHGGGRAEAAPPPSPARAATPARERAPRPARAAAPARSAPVPARRSIREGRRGRLVVVPSAPTPEPAPAAVQQAMPAIVRVPAKVPRKPRASRPVVVAPPPVVATEPIPARSWVVVGNRASNPVRSADGRQSGLRPASALPRPSGARRPRRRGADVLDDAHMRKQCVALEYHRDVALAAGTRVTSRPPIRKLPVARRFEAGDHAQGLVLPPKPEGPSSVTSVLVAAMVDECPVRWRLRRTAC